MSIIKRFNNQLPDISSNAFIAENVVISGNVTVLQNASIWYGCVVRGDVSKIYIGSKTNIQDQTVIHGTRPNHPINKTSDGGGDVFIGDNVTVGHSCIIHACTIENNSFVGMGSILMDLSRVETNSMLAAGSLLSPGKVVKSGELWGGRPARFMRNLSQEELNYIQKSANNYWSLALEYK